MARDVLASRVEDRESAENILPCLSVERIPTAQRLGLNPLPETGMIAKGAPANGISRVPNCLAVSLLGTEKNSAAPDANPFPGSDGQADNLPQDCLTGKKPRPGTKVRSQAQTTASAKAKNLGVAATVEQLSTAEELNASSQQISAAIEQIMKAAGIQPKGTDACAALGEHLRNIARKTCDHPELRGENAAAAQELLASNTMSVNALIESVGARAYASGEADRNVQQLEERRRRIDKILDAIAEVTSQD
ncbi:MAG: hypothetical protein ABSE99_07710 [Terracidiphilus sp.]|jgi:hypothetical protein